MLWLAPAHLKRLVDAAEAAYPNEACALLVGRRGVGEQFRVSRVELARNVAADTRRRFEVDPGLRIGLERELRGQNGSRGEGDGRGQGEAVIGVWHSHPDGAARPSACDVEHVFEPDLVWLITAVSEGQAVMSAAFLPAAGDFRAIGLALDAG